MVSVYDIDFFRKLNNGHQSKSKKETTLYEIRSGIDRTYNTTIDYQPDTLVNGEPMPLIVMEARGSGQDKQQYKKLEAPPNSKFDLGSKVDCFGLKWLVTEINYNQELKLSGKMQLCNYVLKWQDDNGDIIEEECVVSRYKTSASGEDAGKTIVINDTRRNVLLQKNDNTIKLLQGKRFFIDLGGLPNQKAYKLTDLDRTSYIYDGKGFFSLVCTEELTIGDRDRPDLMICDYFEPKEPETPSIGSCRIVYSGQPTIKVGGSKKLYTAIFYDSDGEIITTIDPQWELIQPPELESLNSIFIASEIGNEISIGCKSGDSSIGLRFILKLSAEDSLYGYFEAILEIEIIELF